MAEAPVPFCVPASGLWEHLNGWEVVVAVAFIVGGYVGANVGRMYFMYKIALGRVKTDEVPQHTSDSD